MHTSWHSFLPYDTIAVDTKTKSEKAAKTEAKKRAAEQKVQDKETQLLMLHCMSPGCVKKQHVGRRMYLDNVSNM